MLRRWLKSLPITADLAKQHKRWIGLALLLSKTQQHMKREPTRLNIPVGQAAFALIKWPLRLGRILPSLRGLEDLPSGPSKSLASLAPWAPLDTAPTATESALCIWHATVKKKRKEESLHDVCWLCGDTMKWLSRSQLLMKTLSTADLGKVLAWLATWCRSNLGESSNLEVRKLPSRFWFCLGFFCFVLFCKPLHWKVFIHFLPVADGREEELA